jgi:lysophospholipase L1-like esterase
VLGRELGDGYWVVEAGLNGRTTVWDDPLEPHRNGRELLLPTLLTHEPLDLVVIMLGTNDLKRRLGGSAGEIAAGAAMLVDIVGASGCGPEGGPPQTLLICPAPVLEVDRFDDQFEGATEKSRRLAGHYAEAAAARSCAFLDAGSVIASSEVDGIHLDEAEHERLGIAVAEQVRPLLA